jgi:hypothetical protein
MTYDEYVTYLLSFLWREGDTALAADVEMHVKSAEARLNRDLKIQRMQSSATTFTMTAPDMTLPTDVRRLNNVIDSDTGRELLYCTPTEMAKLRALEPTEVQPRYTLVGRTMRVAGNVDDVDASLVLLLDYHANVPDFKAADTSWVVDEYFDLWHAAVLIHTTSQQKSDERSARFEAMYNSALESVILEDIGNTIPVPQGGMPSGVY